MSLALVVVPLSDFEFIHEHVASHYPKYRNMHLREAHYRDKKRVLRYLHAMYARPGPVKQLEGMISGPEGFWHYKLTGSKSRAQLNVLAEPENEKARERIQRMFLTEILARVAEEQEGSVHHPRRKSGQFYLRRGAPGTPATHRRCLNAVSSKQLDRQFVSVLEAWNFELLCP